MILGLSLFLLGIASVGMLYSLRRAAEGYEDDQGFHIVAKRRGLAGSKTTKTRSLPPTPARRQHVTVG